MAKIKNSSGFEARRQKEAYFLVAPWVLGLLLFFVGPLISSLIYSFSDVRIDAGEVVTDFVGFKHYNEIINVDDSYIPNLSKAITYMFTNLPIIFALSLVLAVVLNQKFVGRTVFRGIFFLPVIIASSVAMVHMRGAAMGAQLFTVSSGAEYSYGGLIDFSGIITELDLPSQISDILLRYLNSVFGIIWKCGIQTILFLSGLQSIPNSLYEVSKIEGASKWEEFWFITVPMLRNVMLLVLVFTMLDLFTSLDDGNYVMTNAIQLMNDKLIYDESSAMLWSYFGIVMAIIGVILFLYNRFCIKRWD